MHTLTADVRYAFRLMRRQPAFTSIALLTIALGVGANTAIFSVVRAVLLRPLPYAEPNRLVIVWGNLVNRHRPKFPLSPIDLRDFREQATLFDGFAGVATFQQTLTGGDADPEQVEVASLTPDFHDVLGVHAVVGRDFGPDDAAPIGPTVDPQARPPTTVMLSHGLWLRRFGGAPDVVGRTLELGGAPAEIVGVMPAGLKLLLGPGSGLATEPDLWTTPRIDVATWVGRRNVVWRVVGRLKPGVTTVQAQGQMDDIAARIRREESLFDAAGFRLDVTPMIDDLTASVRPTILALLDAVWFVLLIACANVANLLLVRASVREREISIRSALGGGRARLVRQLLIESAALGVAGGALGVLVAVGGLRLLLASGPPGIPRLDEVGLDVAVLGYALAVSLSAALVFGVAPAMQASRPRLADALVDRGHAASAGRRRHLRNALIVLEVALSIVLLSGAGLMLRSVVALQRVEPGYDPRNLLTFEVSLPGSRYRQAERLEFTRIFRERLGALPGVSAASAAAPLPLQDSQSSGRYGTEAALTDETAWGQADYRGVLSSYFDTMRTRVVQGRVFTEAEFADRAPVVVIDTTLARILWPGESAVGRRMLIRTGPEPAWVEVVGVVEHQRSHTLAAEGTETVYFAASYLGLPNTLTWVARTAGEPAGLLPQVRAALAAIDPQLPLSDARPMQARVDDAMAGTRFALALIGVFSLVGLALASVGIYGVLASVVRQRTGEIGVRMALGADARGILWLIGRQGLTLTLVGVAVGLAASAVVTRFMASLLVGVTPGDPLTLAVASALFLGIAAVACFVPAWRAARIDPVIALRLG